jgi:hypothetical protein
MNALETLWQLPSEGQALELHLEEAAEEEEGEDNQPLSLLSSLSPSHQPPTYETWKLSPGSSKKKETKLTPS